MKTYLAATATLVIGLTLGGLAVQRLQAQATPPVYSVSEILVSDVDGYRKDYQPPAVASIKAAGGTIIAGGPAKAFVGDAPNARVVIIKWDNYEQVEAWQKSDAYKKAREIGDKVAKWRTMYGVDGARQQ